MLPAELIRKKRDGQILSASELADFIGGYVAGEIPDYQVSALLMAIFFRGMTPEETATLTRTMMESGRTYTIRSERPIIDKHSTGGVGDKVSLILAPLAAACGLADPMVSGRGLGHTGGTLDKLESIPGFNVHLTAEEYVRQVQELGVAMIGQSDDFVPADKKLYALRDVTATVENVSLICASILSKKAASGARGIVMDVKCGTGAFMQDLDSARQLAEGLVSTGTALDLPVRAVLTDMNQPLGRAIGNALEVRESIDCLRGGGPADLREITLELTAEMLMLAGMHPDLEQARATAARQLDNGAALDIFRQMVERQNGDPAVVDNPDLLPGGCDHTEFVANRSGHLSIVNCREVGLAALALGAGRRKATDNIDPAVGLVMHSRIGDPVTAGQPLATIYYRDKNTLAECQAYLNSALAIADDAEMPPALILEKIS